MEEPSPSLCIRSAQPVEAKEGIKGFPGPNGDSGDAILAPDCSQEEEERNVGFKKGLYRYEPAHNSE